MRIKKLTNSNVLKPGQLLVISASPGAGSVDWPVGEWQIVPAAENNE
jgi:hypothetical protein